MVEERYALIGHYVNKYITAVKRLKLYRFHLLNRPGRAAGPAPRLFEDSVWQRAAHLV